VAKLAHFTSNERSVLNPDCFVEHRPGTKIPHVDALSRHVQAVTPDGTLTNDKVLKEQKTHKFRKSLRPGKLNSRSEYFCDADGAIYRRQNHGEHQLAIPKSLARGVISTNHDPFMQLTLVENGRLRLSSYDTGGPGCGRILINMSRYVMSVKEGNRERSLRRH
jgi:hypothetical protein